MGRSQNTTTNPFFLMHNHNIVSFIVHLPKWVLYSIPLGYMLLASFSIVATYVYVDSGSFLAYGNSFMHCVFLHCNCSWSCHFLFFSGCLPDKDFDGRIVASLSTWEHAIFSVHYPSFSMVCCFCPATCIP